MAKDKKISKGQKFDRYGTFPLEEGLDILRRAFRAKQKKTFLGDIPVGCKSVRIQTFIEKGTTCTFCGIKASFLAIERSFSFAGTPADEHPYHVNVWGIDEEGDEVLMTHDHLHARSTGGADKVENTWPMCFCCNMQKSVEESRLADALQAYAKRG